ncbi:MAG TPA: metallophosphoesterase [Paenalcaligenes sp.]|nr:metallophosphoesterase [Paenalcaligenes sp.]
MFHLVTGLTALYVIWSYVRLLSWPRRPKSLLSLVVLLVAEHHLITRTFFGTMASPELPFIVIALLGCAFGALIILACMLLVRDIVGVLWYLGSRFRSQAWVASPTLLYGMGVVALTLAAVGVWNAVRVPAVKTVELHVPKLAQEFDGFTVVQLTDLHASRLLQRPWMQAVVDKTNALNPDLTVLTGDMIDGSPAARANDVPPLGDLQATYGVYAIPGNHEYYVDYVDWLPVFDELGLRLLFNEHVVIEKNNQRLILAGITDATAASFGQLVPDVQAALQGVDKADPVLLLSHRPTEAKTSAAAGADIQLSGHTHGGQMLGLHWLVKRANDGYVSGLYQVDDMQLYVSNGAGLWNGFPLRLGRPSEITQFILRASPAH